MTPSTILRRPSGARRQSGQMIVVFALCLIAIIAMAGLLVDGGRAWAERRQAQAAADTGALAGAVSLNTSTATTIAAKRAAAQAAAKAIAASNGFGVAGNVDCDGNPLVDPDTGVVNDGVKVNWPPSAASEHPDDSLYIEVYTTRAMRTTFAGMVGQFCWLVTARAVAQIPGPRANCSMCAITKYHGDGQDDIFQIDNTGHMRADGNLFANGPHIVGTSCVPGAGSSGNFNACGTAIHLAHTGGTPGEFSTISAPTISVSGGWTSNADTQAHGDHAPPCTAPAALKDPRNYALHGWPPSNVCVGATPIDDPFNPPAPGIAIEPPDALVTPIPQLGERGCPNDDPRVRLPTGTVGHPARLSIDGTDPGAAAGFVICPGLYPGGFSVFGDNRTVHVDMVPGVYIMLGGGFQVSGTASITGNGIMVYNTEGARSYARPTLPWTGVVPTCTVGECKVTTANLTGVDHINVETPTTPPNGPPYTLTLTAPTLPNPTGTVTFYDGDDPLPGCEAVALVAVGTRQAKASCVVTFDAFGRHWITGFYGGDDKNAAVMDDMSTDVRPTSPLGMGNISICTGPVGPCNATGSICVLGGPCTVRLSAPPDGAPFHGMLFFQVRTVGGTDLGLELKPYMGLAPCVDTDPGPGEPSWMTDGVPGGPNPGADPPLPCGPLGGLSGSVYVPHSRSDPPCPDGSFDCGHDGAVEFRADGATNLQIIAGRISLQYNNDVRFLFDPKFFVGGGTIKLVE